VLRVVHKQPAKQGIQVLHSLIIRFSIDKIKEYNKTVQCHTTAVVQKNVLGVPKVFI
jgi:hypothetical protein